MFLEKSTKTDATRAATRAALFDSNMHQIFVAGRFAPDATGELAALPQTP